MENILALAEARQTHGKHTYVRAWMSFADLIVMDLCIDDTLLCTRLLQINH